MAIIVFYTLFLVGHAVAQSENIALGKPANQSSVNVGKTADLAVDGNFDSYFGWGSCIHTLHSDKPQWWMVDLQAFYKVTDVWIQNRMYYDNLHDFVVDVFKTNPYTGGGYGKVMCNSYPGTAEANAYVHMPCQEMTFGQYVRVLKLAEFIRSNDALIICEVVVKGSELMRPCGIVETLPGSADSSMTSSNQIDQGLTRFQCLHRCYYNYNCQGFNFKEIDGSCQIITDLDQPIQVNTGWTYYPMN